MADNDLSNDSSEVPQDELMLPGFIAKREDGIFVKLPNLHEYGGFETFVNRLFGGDIFLSGLDYGSFAQLLYDPAWLETTQAEREELKIAEKISFLLPERRALYQAPDILENGRVAKYAFGPVYIEEVYEEPVYGEPDENGVAPVIEKLSKIKQHPAKLEFDEFIAEMWLKGVRFGIDEKAIRQAIIKNTSDHIIIARCLEPTKGCDAEILEVCPDLHRDNSPKILADGRADLHSRKNRFPQVAKGTTLLRKIPRVLGQPGLDVSGKVIEPDIPKDVDISALASTGTHVVQGPDGECIVPLLDGFLTLDEKTGTVTVTKKIENKEGISAKTTGSLTLDVDEFIEHGEVQEGCVVTGKHMTFMSNVFGGLISHGGNIVIKGSLSGGFAESTGGNVTLGSRTSCAAVRAREGEVAADYCDTTLIIGKIIRVDHAVNCELIADEVIANVVEGCMVAARIVKIASSQEHKNNETLVTMFTPDLSVFDQDIAIQHRHIAESRELITEHNEAIELLKSDAEFAKYWVLYEKIKSGEVRLTTEQVAGWRKLMDKNALTVKKMLKLEEKINMLETSIKEAEDKIVSIEHDRDGTGGDVSCVIDEVAGQTIGQTMTSALGVDEFVGLTGEEARNLLQKMDSHKKRIFSTGKGAVSWRFREPKDA